MNVIKRMPLVSVVMASYNEPPAFIEKAVESILGQTYSEYEFLVFDDSTDNKTREVLDRYLQDEHIRVFRGQTRIGFVQSLNMGLAAAKGKYIARMDADDIARPERLEKEVAYLEMHPDVAVVGGQIALIDESGNAVSSRHYPLGGVRLSLFSALRNPLAHPTVMMQREIVDAGFRYDESLRMSEDLDLWLRLMNQGYKLANLKDVVLGYRVGDNFAEKRTRREQIEYMEMVRRRNFSSRYPIRSALSCAAGWMLLHTPVRWIQHAYKSENGQS